MAGKLEVPYMLVATKTDKLSNNQQRAQLRAISRFIWGSTRGDVFGKNRGRM